MALMRILQSQVTSLTFNLYQQQPSRTKSNFTKSMHPMKEWKSKGRGLKISVVGSGQVGAAICSCLLLRKVTQNLVIMDVKYNLAQAETLDLLHGSVLLGNPRIVACSDGSRTKDSDIVVMTAGARPSGKNRSRLDAMHGTMEIFKAAIPLLVKQSPNAIFVIVSNPVDVMTFAVQCLAKLPKHRCLTTGCHLDSLRFRYFIAERLNVPPADVQAYVIGEHGVSAVPVWSSVCIGGIQLKDVIKELACGEDPEKWWNFEEQVTTAGASVGKVKGYTNWAIAATCTDVVEALTSDQGKILCVGTDMQGLHGIEHSVVLSLPCLVKSGGISHVFELPLTSAEQEKLNASAESLIDAQCSLKF
ncbi:L-lactate dehydrogenase B chain [Drosophila serrata]|uniref:L-lactate dehydrogenase B chain n=1 Tax=Drosophila serrata TaxID=7274 RepID=UPI000A1D0259|nr:L-lactate dehydrogenase B chain [Drosophila serrata]